MTARPLVAAVFLFFRHLLSLCLSLSLSSFFSFLLAVSLASCFFPFYRLLRYDSVFHLARFSRRIRLRRFTVFPTERSYRKKVAPTSDLFILISTQNRVPLLISRSRDVSEETESEHNKREFRRVSNQSSIASR